METVKTNIMVSVICVVYNHEKYLKKTLDGLVNQITNFDFEVLVHDDASTDKSREIIQQYADNYFDKIIPIYQTENKYSKGENIAYNYIFPKVRGKYIAFCEGDDYWCDYYKLQMQCDLLERNSTYGMCVHKVQKCIENGELCEQYWPSAQCDIENGIVSKADIINLLYNKGEYPFHTSSYMVRADFLKKFQENNIKLLSCYDIGILRIAILQGDFYYIDKVMSVRRCEQKDSWSIRYEKASGNELFEIYKRWLDIEVAFNEEAGKEYQAETEYRIYTLLLSFLWKSENVKLFHQLWNKYGRNLLRQRNFSIKQKMIILLMRYIPSAILVRKCIREKIKKE